MRECLLKLNGILDDMQQHLRVRFFLWRKMHCETTTHIKILQQSYCVKIYRLGFSQLVIICLDFHLFLPLLSRLDSDMTTIHTKPYQFFNNLHLYTKHANE